MPKHITIVIAIPDGYNAEELHMPIDQALHKYLPGAAEWVVIDGAQLPEELPEPFRDE